MADRQVIINSQVYKLIPLGFCACGCGGKTSIPSKNHTKNKRMIGRPMKYITGHNVTKCSGSRYVTTKGYVRILIPGHHLADKNGYVYEHRLIAESNLGRRLNPGETPHHINGKKADNRPENIMVYKTSGEHSRAHFKKK